FIFSGSMAVNQNESEQARLAHPNTLATRCFVIGRIPSSVLRNCTLCRDSELLRFCVVPRTSVFSDGQKRSIFSECPNNAINRIATTIRHTRVTALTASRTALETSVNCHSRSCSMPNVGRGQSPESVQRN